MNCENIGVPAEQAGSPEIAPKENVALGIVGALAGALLGGASIVLLSQLGYIASISGFILAFCTLKGYELLGKGLSKKGVVICVILMLVTPFVADLIDWALLVYRSWADYGVTFLECVQLLPELFAEGVITTGEYLKNLGMIYLFVIMGGFYTIRNAFKN